MKGQIAHLDADVLAEFRAGLITRRHGARIAAHLAGCDRCTAVDGELAGVSAMLAAVPAPAVPDNVAQRLDTMLAAEVASRDSAERAGDDSSREKQAKNRPAPNRGFRLLALRVLAPVAVVLLAAGGYGLSRLVGGSPAETASTAAGQAARAPHGVAAPEARPFSSAAVQPLRILPADFALVVSPTDFLAATLEQQMELEVHPPASMPTPALKTITASKAVRACVHHVADGDGLVLIESAHFEGQPVIVIVVRTSTGDLAFITGPRCSATNRDVLAHTTVPAGISGP